MHFRVFPCAERADGTDKAKRRAMGEKAGADFFLHASMTVREKKKSSAPAAFMKVRLPWRSSAR